MPNDNAQRQDSSPRASDSFHVLSLSGGGYLGLFTAIILAEFERRLGRPISSAFDLMAGTSIGGLLALALALEVPAEVLVRYLIDRGTDIFSARAKPRSALAKRVDFFRYFVSSKYRTDELVKVLDEIYAGEPVIGDIPNRRVVVPAVNLTLGQAQVFKTPHQEKYRNDWRVPIRDVALATSAAPTFFPIASVNDQLFVDGGLFAQSPDLVAIHEAERFLGVNRDAVRLLSIGTTTSRFSLPHTSGTNFGLVNWAFNSRLWSATISAQQQIVDYMAGYLLQDRYVRIDAIQSEDQNLDLALDVATPNAQRIIADLAQRALDESSSALNDFTGHHAPKAVFYHGENRSTTKNNKI